MHVTTPERKIPDGHEPSGIAPEPSGICIRDGDRQERAVGNKLSGKSLVPDGRLSRKLFVTAFPDEPREPRKRIKLTD